MAKTRTFNTAKCAKCGFNCSSEAKFCPDCGAKLVAATAASEKGFDGLAYLHFAEAAYLIIATAANSLAQALLLFLIPYILVGVLSLFVGWQFYCGKLTQRWTKSLSLVVVIVGIAVTVSAYVIGVGRLQGLIGPAWVIFVINGWALIRAWSKI